jgi:hypothetical protein
MANDKKTIGLTTENQRVMEQLVERKLFKDGIAAAKFALAMAVDSGIGPKPVEGTGTIWNVGSFDTDSELKNLIPVLFPGSETPYRTVEELINAGFELLGSKVRENPNITSLDLLGQPAGER